MRFKRDGRGSRQSMNECYGFHKEASKTIVDVNVDYSRLLFCFSTCKCLTKHHGQIYYEIDVIDGWPTRSMPPSFSRHKLSRLCCFPCPSRAAPQKPQAPSSALVVGRYVGSSRCSPVHSLTQTCTSLLVESAGQDHLILSHHDFITGHSGGKPHGKGGCLPPVSSFQLNSDSIERRPYLDLTSAGRSCLGSSSIAPGPQRSSLRCRCCCLQDMQRETSQCKIQAAASEKCVIDNYYLSSPYTTLAGQGRHTNSQTSEAMGGSRWKAAKNQT
ncbi:hypothetical protein B0T22DRAFT_248120 [Podospora appendiculata]|uniref:Uncharacterized protein n=1 Tax=Podospora appendiculata TaxID=314037 RepID=A0AAE0X2V4_9PEZI|nr:hypothetical protein B0T22DRAFT_248120 [Podospora appendiculata]